MLMLGWIEKREHLRINLTSGEPEEVSERIKILGFVSGIEAEMRPMLSMLPGMTTDVKVGRLESTVVPTNAWVLKARGRRLGVRNELG